MDTNQAPHFIHLRVHSAYSLLEGAVKLKDVVDLTHKNHMPAVAVTDTGNLFGALEFALTASGKGIQPIIGCTLKVRAQSAYVPERTIHPLYDSLVLLVQDEQGYKNLLKLVSKSFLETEGADTPHVTYADLHMYAEGLIALSGGLDGVIGRLLREKKPREARAAAKELEVFFKGRFYLEVTRLGFALEKKIEPALLRLAQELALPIVATNPVFFANEKMYDAHDALLCVAGGTYVGVQERRRLTPAHYFKSQQEMCTLFKDLPEALENTVQIARRCAYMPQMAPPMLPPFPCESGRTETEELEAQAKDGLQRRLEQSVFSTPKDDAEKEAIQQKYDARLAHELMIIKKMGYAGYFLIVADFIKWAKKQGIPVGPGRGSGAGSLVAWVLTITDMDPIRFNLIFERFLNPERVSMPDFDVDFCQDRRDEVIAYVQQRYGKDKVAQIITFGKLQARAVLRDVGRVLQMPYGQVDRLCKMVPNNPAAPVTLQEAIDQEPDLRREIKNDPTVARLMEIALQLEGLYRHASTHAAGIIIGDRPLDELIPLYRDPKSDMQVTQFNMKDVEKAGLVKFDFLGLKTLTILEKAAEMAREEGHAGCYIDTIPLEDKPTFELLKRVETSGVFQLEGSGMRDVLRQLQPDRFEEIIALVALYRPGPMDDIPRYLACKHGKEEVQYMHPMLENILKETFGVMVYQEQVMQIAQIMSGYSLGDADLLRRAMGKKIKSEMDAQRKRFVEGAQKNGVAQKLASQIFDQIAKFAGYGFNKSHSAPYGLLAYQTAYLKANFPHAFMAATMTYDMGNTDKLDFYRQELTQMNITLLPPDINASKVTFAVEGDAIRYGLAAIKNVGEQAMADVVAERGKGGVYKDIWDFSQRVSAKVLNKRQLEHLIWAGAFDQLHPNRHQLFASLDRILSYANSIQSQKNTGQKSLFGGSTAGATSFNTGELLEVAELRSAEKMQKEQAALGFYLTSHPLKMYETLLADKKFVSSSALESMAGRTVAMAGIIADVQERLSKKGKKFGFVRLSDQSGSFEVMAFMETLPKVKQLLEEGAPCLLTVGVQSGEQGMRLTLQDIRALALTGAERPRTLSVTLNCVEGVAEVGRILSDAGRGMLSVRLIIPQGDDHVTLLLPDQYGYQLDLVEKINAQQCVAHAALDEAGTRGI